MPYLETSSRLVELAHGARNETTKTMFARLIPLFIIGLPLAEIAGFIAVGRALGLLPTLLAVVVTGIAGALVLRWQGLAALGELQRRVAQGEMPARAVGDAMLIGLGGLLLLIPGFISDLVGVALLLPVTRAAIFGWLSRRLKVVEVDVTAYRRTAPRQIDLDDDEWRSGPSL